jgi:hypothetical protein
MKGVLPAVFGPPGWTLGRRVCNGVKLLLTGRRPAGLTKSRLSTPQVDVVGLARSSAESGGDALSLRGARPIEGNPSMSEGCRRARGSFQAKIEGDATREWSLTGQITASRKPVHQKARVVAWLHMASRQSICKAT